MSDKSFPSKVYDTLAEGGKLYTSVNTIILTTIGAGLIFFGIYCIFKKPRYTIPNIGTVVGISNSMDIPQCKNVQCEDPICKQIQINENVTYNCTFRILYKDSDGIFNLSNLIQSSPSHIKSGDKIPIFINKDDKLDVSLQNDDLRSIGWVIILFVLLILSFSWAILWLTQRSNLFAAIQGTSVAVNVLGNSLK